MIHNTGISGGKKGTAKVTVHYDYKYNMYGLLNGELNSSGWDHGNCIYDVDSMVVVEAYPFSGSYTNVTCSGGIEFLRDASGDNNSISNGINGVWVPFLVRGDGDIYYS